MTEVKEGTEEGGKGGKEEKPRGIKAEGKGEE